MIRMNALIERLPEKVLSVHRFESMLRKFGGIVSNEHLKKVSVDQELLESKR